MAVDLVPTRQTECCLACGADGLTLVEVIPITLVAEAWASDREARYGGRQADRRAWLETVVRAIGTDSVRFDRCQHCGLEMSSPRRPWPEGIYPEDEDYPLRWEFGRCLEDLGNEPLRILELGCGSGEFLAMARNRGHHALGIDFNLAAVKKANSRGLEAVYGGFDRLREYLSLKGHDKTFDAVVVFHVIEHLAEPDAILRGLAPFIRPGTRLVVSCPGPRRFTRLIREQQIGTRDLWDYPPHHVLRWTIPALRSFLGTHGWNLLSALEEPLPWVGAISQIGCTRAMRGGYIHNPVRRRISIAWAGIRLLYAVVCSKMTGLSIYVLADRPQ